MNVNMEERFSPEMFEKVEVLPPTHEEIATAAYYIWLSEGRPEGCAERHWHEARTQLIRIRQAEALEKLKQRANSELVECKTERTDVQPELSKKSQQSSEVKSNTTQPAKKKTTAVRKKTKK
ncbi:MAG: DUF2934 domain-containing protein [Verrucomicrobiae bacterium]|nr:DUF2934 domain-containing protein [Verrucomicrobiae bacterium]